MSKTNDTSTLGRTPQVRELRDDELENVSGGAIIAADFAYPSDWMGRRSDGERS